MQFSDPISPRKAGVFDDAVAKYGEKARDGVIVIATK
jgi:hypothetical protein